MPTSIQNCDTSNKRVQRATLAVQILAGLMLTLLLASGVVYAEFAMLDYSQHFDFVAATKH